MTADQWLIPPLPDSIPPSILSKADVLVTKTAFLAGLLAPETAACLSRQLKVSDAEYSRIIDGHNTDLEVLEDATNLASMQSTLGEITELRRRLIAALAHHYHLVQTQPLSDGNGAVARLIVHTHFAQIGLHPQLWSLSRGIARRQEEYHAALGITGDTQERQLASGFQRTDRASLTFIEFMLDVCHEEVDYMTTALSRHQLRESVAHAYRTNSRLTEASVSPETMPALLALLIQGSLPRTEFVTFTGLPREAASDQLNRLLNLGIVVSPPSNLQRLEVSLPAWFAQVLLPDFHLA
ncbi:Fic family protein [Pseudomonas sp. MM213]|uniref:Fic family protein n=1 Tax=Pseudomonas sp. MM213 TaxID=2866807 RepID=UPI001CF13934|nr:Fic family protein [Pseudomonas sp. MM213]UCP11541.1 Fic family protein [Pseudomonas sp. MM213]